MVIKGRLTIPAEQRQAIEEKKRGLKKQKEDTRRPWGKITGTKEEGIETHNRDENREQEEGEKRFMRINGKQRQGRKGEVVLEDGGRDIVDR